MNIPLTTFPAPLPRLILCGRPGLAPAWGPVRDQYGYLWPWNPLAHDVAWPRGDSGEGITLAPLASPEAWSLPLDAASPWPARLAMVAALMASAWMPEGVSAEVVLGECWLHLYTYSGGVADIRAWACDDGGNIEPGAVGLDLPTLPQHLQTHPPTVALLLALYDVPEIRARVEQT